MTNETQPPEADIRARLLISCPDRPGIVASVTGFLFRHGVNITHCDQHATAPQGGTFFMRVEFETSHLDAARQAIERLLDEEVG